MFLNEALFPNLGHFAVCSIDRIVVEVFRFDLVIFQLNAQASQSQRIRACENALVNDDRVKARSSIPLNMMSVTRSSMALTMNVTFSLWNATLRPQRAVERLELRCVLAIPERAPGW